MSKAAKMERTAVAKELQNKYGVVAFKTTNATQRINSPELAPKLAVSSENITGDASFLGLPNKSGGYDIIPHGTIRGGYIGDMHDYAGGGYFFDSDFKGGHVYSPDQIRSIVPASINANGDIVKKGSFSLYSKGSRMAEETTASSPKPPSPPAEQPVEIPKKPAIKQPRETPKEPIPNSKPTIEPAPEGPRQSVYNPNNTPSTPAGGFKLPNKHLDDFRPTSAPKKSVQDIFKKAYDNQKRQEALESRKRIAGYMRDNEAAAAAAENNKGVKGVINSVKSSVTNMKAKYDKATEALYEIAGKNHTPTEFQQQTTAMVGKFSGGKWTGGVNTEKMNWLEANAHENLYSSVGRDYDNLIAKMQGAKTQEEFSKLMEDHHIKYSDGMSGAELNKNINAHFNERIDGGPGVGNYIVGNKAVSGAMLGVAGASVLALSDSRGRRSNSQLYSSQI